MKKTYLKTPEAVIKALKEGKEVKDDNGYSYKLVEGFIVNTNGDNFFVGDVISSFCHPHILEEEPFKIEVGKWYETRNHRKARCYLINDPYCFFTIDNYSSFGTDKEGHYTEESHSLDIIGPWRD